MAGPSVYQTPTAISNSMFQHAAARYSPAASTREKGIGRPNSFAHAACRFGCACRSVACYPVTMMIRYDTSRTWRWNLEHAPDPGVPVVCAPVPGHWSWCGLPVDSPLGIPAGPLLNSQWLLYYANRGFDVLVYKTVRSSARDCYPLPNLVPVRTGPLETAGATLPESRQMDGTWAVSFGMPSQPPDLWRRDVTAARDRLPAGKVLVVSVVGTQDESIKTPRAALEQLADDFATCAAWAMDSGAHGIEANFSCPNVATADGQLYQQPECAAEVAERIRDRIGAAPLVLKIGRVESQAAATDLLQHIGPFVNGLAMTNSIAAHVSGQDGRLLFGGQRRGICGAATRGASVDQTALFRKASNAGQLTLDLIGVGGISTADHVREYLAAGADSVAVATAAMMNAEIGLSLRQALTPPCTEQPSC